MAKRPFRVFGALTRLEYQRLAAITRVCKKCGETKPMHFAFTPNKNSSGGFDTTCRLCRSIVRHKQRPHKSCYVPPHLCKT